MPGSPAAGQHAEGDGETGTVCPASEEGRQPTRRRRAPDTEAPGTIWDPASQPPCACSRAFRGQPQALRPQGGRAARAPRLRPAGPTQAPGSASGGRHLGSHLDHVMRQPRNCLGVQGAVARGARKAGLGALTGEAQLPGEPRPGFTHRTRQAGTAAGGRGPCPPWWRQPQAVAPAHALHLPSHKRSEVCPNHRQTDFPTSPH